MSDLDDDGIIRPHPKQVEFLVRQEFEVAFLGGRGRGSSFALCMDPLYDIEHPEWRGLLLRRKTTQMQDIIDTTHRLYPRTGGHWVSSESTWVWPSGARLQLAYLNRDEDKEQYWGRGIHWLGIDELTHWEEKTYTWLFTSVRSSHPTIRCRVRSTANPIGPGSRWIKRRWIEQGPPGVPIWDERRKVWRAYVHGTVDDNLSFGLDYQNMLEGIEDVALRNAFRYGDFNAVEGAMFSQWDSRLHVVPPFTPEPWHRRVRFGDWGYVENYYIGWAAVDAANNIAIYRELTGNNQDASVVAQKIRAIEARAGEVGITGPLDAQAWERRGSGLTPAGYFLEAGVRWFRSAKGPNSRVLGVQEMHRRLNTVTEVHTPLGLVRVPAITVSAACPYLIETLPALQRDPNDQEDVLEGGDDHGWDALRYLLRYKPSRVNNARKLRRPPSGSGRDPNTGYS